MAYSVVFAQAASVPRSCMGMSPLVDKHQHGTAWCSKFMPAPHLIQVKLLCKVFPGGLADAIAGGSHVGGHLANAQVQFGLGFNKRICGKKPTILTCRTPAHCPAPGFLSAAESECIAHTPWTPTVAALHPAARLCSVQGQPSIQVLIIIWVSEMQSCM